MYIIKPIQSFNNLFIKINVKIVFEDNANQELSHIAESAVEVEKQILKKKIGVKDKLHCAVKYHLHL